jgi:hypothetical protein
VESGFQLFKEKNLNTINSINEEIASINERKEVIVKDLNSHEQSSEDLLHQLEKVVLKVQFLQQTKEYMVCHN